MKIILISFAILTSFANAAELNITLSLGETYVSPIMVKRITGFWGNHDINGKYFTGTSYSDKPDKALVLKCSQAHEVDYCDQTHTCIIVPYGKVTHIELGELLPGRSIFVSCKRPQQQQRHTNQPLFFQGR